MRGKMISLSIPRKLVCDLLHFASQVPTVPVQRIMSLGPLVAARAELTERPGWTSIFTKAYALLAGEMPALRRAYVKVPWPHLYEYPDSVACVTIERSFDEEEAVFIARISKPASLSIAEIGERLRVCSTAPPDQIPELWQAIIVGHFPRFVRHLLWWLGLNVGRERAKYFGTFGVSVYSALGSESLHPLSPATSTLNYGVIGEDGKVAVRIIYDHRVMDGATVARALARLEEVLCTDIVAEVRGMQSIGQGEEPAAAALTTSPDVA